MRSDLYFLNIGHQSVWSIVLFTLRYNIFCHPLCCSIFSQSVIVLHLSSPYLRRNVFFNNLLLRIPFYSPLCYAVFVYIKALHITLVVLLRLLIEVTYSLFKPGNRCLFKEFNFM